MLVLSQKQSKMYLNFNDTIYTEKNSKSSHFEKVAAVNIGLSKLMNTFLLLKKAFGQKWE